MRLEDLNGKFIPVIDNLSYSVSVRDEDSSNLYLNFTKVRDECRFREIEFFLNEYDKHGDMQSLKLQAVFAGKEQIRYAGAYEGIGPWRVGATADQLQNMSVIVWHRCHSGFQTVTRYRIVDGVPKRI